MLDSFDLPKAMQAIAALLRFHDANRLSSVRLLKLLYIADRESIKETGRSISGDQALAMKHGPQLRELHQLIMAERAPPPSWSQCFRGHLNQLEMIREPENGVLSIYENAKLRALTTRYGSHSDEDLEEITRNFEEWKNNDSTGSCALIPLDEILRAVGRSAEQVPNHDPRDEASRESPLASVSG